MARSNKSIYAILGLLSRYKLSGYDIKGIMTKISSYYWSESNAQIYPTLKILESKAYVTSKIDEASGARKKKIYAITPKGMLELKNWLNEPVKPSHYREELLLKLSSSQHLPQTVIIKHFEEYKASILEQKKLQESYQDHIEHDHVGKPDQRYLRMVYRHMDHILEAKLAWCEEMLSEME